MTKKKGKPIIEKVVISKSRSRNDWWFIVLVLFNNELVHLNRIYTTSQSKKIAQRLADQLGVRLEVKE